MTTKKAILFASTNKGKLIEVRTTASEFGIEILSPSDLSDELGIGVPKVDEDGATYLENAKKKAAQFFEWSGITSLSDDTGLEVSALSGRPGVATARFSGPDATPKQNMDKLLEEMNCIEDRRAKFVCRLYLISKENKPKTVEDYLEGMISKEPRGGGGFGYDPIFIVENSGKTLAELKQDGSSVETHRIKALRRLFSEI